MYMQFFILFFTNKKNTMQNMIYYDLFIEFIILLKQIEMTLCFIYLYACLSNMTPTCFSQDSETSFIIHHISETHDDNHISI